MDQDKLKNIISEEVNRVLEQEVARHELSLLESKFRDVSNKFKDALDRLPDRAFTTKNIEKLIKKLKERRPDSAMAYAKSAFGWLMKENDNPTITEAPKVAPQSHREIEFGVQYLDSKGRPKKKGEPIIMRFKTKAQADKYAKRGNKVDKVGGVYTVVRVPVQEKFDSKAQQRYMFATNPKAAKKLASKMTAKDYDELPDKVSKENVAPDHDGKAAPFGSGYKKVKDLEESTKAYEKALQKMARDNKLKMLSKSDKEKLIKIAQMLKKANESVNEAKKIKPFDLGYRMNLRRARAEFNKGENIAAVSKRGKGNFKIDNVGDFPKYPTKDWDYAFIVKEAKLNEATYKKGQKVKYQLDKGSIKALKPSEGTISKVKKVGKYIQYTIMDGGPVPVWEPEILGLSGADKKAGKGVFESVNENKFNRPPDGFNWNKARADAKKAVAREKERSKQVEKEKKELLDAIKIFRAKIKKQGRITNARDEEHLKKLIDLYKMKYPTRPDLAKLNEATNLWKHFDAKMKLQDTIMDLEYDMKMINKDLSQLHKDMEQEAEPEGGPKATRYGRDIEKKEKEYKKKKAEFKKLMKKLDKMEQY
jgi:hypothetical protein